jgi:proline utilization trans-activator
VLQDVLSNRGNGNQGLVTPIKALLKTASHSASNSLRILSALQYQHLLGKSHGLYTILDFADLTTECFLPFDLEQAFSAAFVLILTTAVPGVPEPNSKDLQTSLNVLDTMIGRGNVVARYRKEELNRLEEMLQVFQAQRNSRPMPEVHENGTTTIPDRDQIPMPHGNVEFEVCADQASTYGHATVSTVNGLASEQIMSLAGLLDWMPESHEFDDDQLAGNWLWTESIATDYDLHGVVP